MQGKKTDLPIALSLSDCLGPKKETSMLLRVAKPLRLSIFVETVSLWIDKFKSIKAVSILEALA